MRMSNAPKGTERVRGGCTRKGDVAWAAGKGKWIPVCPSKIGLPVSQFWAVARPKSQERP